MISLSIITTVLNDQLNISNCIMSVIKQKINKNFEHIIVDGGSTDDTLNIIKKFQNNYKHIKLFKKNNISIYDGINFGISRSRCDYIGLLHSDDFFSNKNTLKYIKLNFKKNPDICALYSNVIIVKRNNSKKVVRIFKTKQLYSKDFLKGLHPPHTSLFLKKFLFYKYGFYNNKLKIAADFELMLRFFGIYQIKTKFINKNLVVMRSGGTSTKNLINIVKSNYEVYKSYKINNLKINLCVIINKIVTKFFQIRFKNIF